MKMNLIKLPVSEIQKVYGRTTAIITTDEKSNLVYGKIPLRTIITVEYKLNRKYHTHKHLFKMFEHFVNCNGLKQDLVLYDDFGEGLLTISQEKVITPMIIRNQFDYDPLVRTILDICEELFLDKVERVNVLGEIELVKGSISYSNLDETAFKVFKEKVAYFLSRNLNVDVLQFEMECSL